MDFGSLHALEARLLMRRAIIRLLMIVLISTRTAKITESTNNYPFVIIVFRGKSVGIDHGVEFEVSDRGTNQITFQPKMVSLDVSTPFSYKFPPLPLTKYGPNERLFVIIKGAIGMHTRVRITDFHSESCCDWMKMLYLNIAENSMFTAQT